MLTAIKRLSSPLLLLMSIGFWSGSGAIAQDAAWHVGKSSGDVWVTNAGVQQASVSSETTLKPGDYVRTGQTGRVLLVRGAESMLISPNSVIHIPTENTDGMSTTIVQRAGTILFDVEKRNVRHFEVNTPYLAAVVKGTQFQVSVDKSEARVDVRRGQVEVIDYKSGQFALVKPDQVAKVAAQGSGGLALSGSGTLSPIQQGAPRSSPVDAIAAPEERLAANGTAEKQQNSAVALSGEGVAVSAASAKTSSTTVARNEDAVKENTWASRVTPAANRSGNENSWWGRSGDLGFDLSLPFAAGLFVAFAVAVKRRWQKRRQRLS
jgi:hypothetical protein